MFVLSLSFGTEMCVCFCVLCEVIDGPIRKVWTADVRFHSHFVEMQHWLIGGCLSVTSNEPLQYSLLSLTALSEFSGPGLAGSGAP